MPRFLLALRPVAAEFAGTKPEEFRHVLVTEYGSGAGTGWHRDKAVFGEVVGVSLLSPCIFRMRRKVNSRLLTPPPHADRAGAEADAAAGRR